MKRDMYVTATAYPEGTMQRNVFYESFLQDAVERSSSDLLTAKHIALLKIADDMLVVRNGHMHGLMGPSLGFL